MMPILISVHCSDGAATVTAAVFHHMLQIAVAAGFAWSDWPYGLCSELVAAGYSAEVDWLHSSGTAQCGSDCPVRQQRCNYLKLNNFNCIHFRATAKLRGTQL
jgi:hypothetical protein